MAITIHRYIISPINTSNTDPGGDADVHGKISLICSSIKCTPEKQVCIFSQPLLWMTVMITETENW